MISRAISGCASARKLDKSRPRTFSRTMMWRRASSRTMTLSPDVVPTLATSDSGTFAPVRVVSIRLAMASGLERTSGGKRTVIP